MKKIINNSKYEVALLSEIDDRSYVGIQFGIECRKCWVIEIDGTFHGMRIGDRTTGHNWTTLNKQEYIEKAFEQDGTQVFVFEDKNELIMWLIDN